VGGFMEAVSQIERTSGPEPVDLIVVEQRKNELNTRG